jgi:hypothetical protein
MKNAGAGANLLHQPFQDRDLRFGVFVTPHMLWPPDPATPAGFGV